jgi:hypothetical protein
MEKLIDFISASLANLFIVAGLIFLGISVVGNISGKIQPGKGGRILSGLLGLAFLGVGIKMNFTGPLAATSAPPTDIPSQSTTIPPDIAGPTANQVSQDGSGATPVPIDTPTNTPSPTPSSKWGTWQALGGDLVEAPAVSSWGNGRLDVFVRGTDDQLWHMYYWNGPDWSGWEPLGGSITSSPAAVSWGSDRIDIFARGGDGHLWHMSWNNGWTGWEPLGGDLVDAPAVASWQMGVWMCLFEGRMTNCGICPETAPPGAVGNPWVAI